MPLCVLSCVQIFATPWTVALQAPLSMGFPRQEYWSGSLFSPPGDLPHPGIKLMSPALTDGFSTTEPLRKLPKVMRRHIYLAAWIWLDFEKSQLFFHQGKEVKLTNMLCDQTLTVERFSEVLIWKQGMPVYLVQFFHSHSTDCNREQSFTPCDQHRPFVFKFWTLEEYWNSQENF